MTQGQDTSGGLPLQDHGVAATMGSDCGEKSSVAAESWIFAADDGLRERRSSAAPPRLWPATSSDEQEKNKEWPGGCAVRKVEGAQSSKRELLSRKPWELVLGAEGCAEEDFVL